MTMLKKILLEWLWLPVLLTSDTDMNKELTSWYQKGVSAASMVGTRDNLGYTNNWYDNNYQEELDNSW